MKLLIAAPPKSPLVQRTIHKLKEHKIECMVVSFDSETGFYSCRSISLGPLKSFFDYFKFWKMFKIVNEYKPDLIHAHVLNHYGLICSFLTYPLLVTMWGSDVMLAPNEGGWKKYIFRAINHFVIKRADGLHTSSVHVAEEAKNQCKKAAAKTQVFYWGLHLNSPQGLEKEAILEKFNSKYNIKSRKYFVFNRGLGDVYNPDLVSKVINEILNSDRYENNIVILRAYSTDSEVDRFFTKIDKSKIIYIDEVLTEKELHELYKFSIAHFSLTRSDALGGGVIEPALCGSYPILSDIPPYVTYSRNNSAYIVNTKNYDCVQQLMKYLETIRPDFVPRVDSVYDNDYIIAKTLEMYKSIVNRRS